MHAVASWREEALVSAGVVWSGVLRAAMRGFSGCGRACLLYMTLVHWSGAPLVHGIGKRHARLGDGQVSSALWLLGASSKGGETCKEPVLKLVW